VGGARHIDFEDTLCAHLHVWRVLLSRHFVEPNLNWLRSHESQFDGRAK
jgi:hypothetical protein